MISGSGSNIVVASNPVIEKAQAGENTPDASTHSRSSSKKSNHSIHSVHNGRFLCGRLTLL